MKNVTRSERIFIIVSYILLGLLAVVTIVPLLSVLITSFVSASEIARARPVHPLAGGLGYFGLRYSF